MLTETAAYEFTLDSDQFSIAKPSEKLLPKAEHKITVSFKAAPNADSPAPVRGQLQVTCTDIPASSRVRWVYYLEGVAATTK